MAQGSILAMLLAAGSTIAAAAEPILGGESIGWRGDGSGIYPGADPPIRWHRASEALKGLRTRSGPPRGDEEEGGATAVEYALMVALIAVVCIAAVSLIGSNANTKFSSVGTTLGSAS